MPVMIDTSFSVFTEVFLVGSLLVTKISITTERRECREQQQKQKFRYLSVMKTIRKINYTPISLEKKGVKTPIG
jgi:hypothetical protein